MRITPEEVEHVAHLARLYLSAEEVEAYTKQLGEILDYVAELQELDTKDVAPMSHALSLVNAMRDDKVEGSLPNEEALANGPETEEGAFVVPRII